MDKKRTANFTNREKIIIITIIKKYKNIIEGKEISTAYLKKKTETWKNICHEFNAESEIKRDVKQIKTLYFNMKRKMKKDYRDFHKADESSFNPQLDEIGAHLLAVFSDQSKSVPNSYDEADICFIKEENNKMKVNNEHLREYNDQMKDCNEKIGDYEDQIRDYKNQNRDSHLSPETDSKEPIILASSSSIATIPDPDSEKPPRVWKKRFKKINYKDLYHKKMYEIACFELKSKKILHNLDVKIKKKQLEQFIN